MELKSIDKRLLEVASQYSTKEEFQKNNYPQYLIAKDRHLLPIAFPYSKKITITSGIFKLYKETKCVYIGYDFVNIQKAIAKIDFVKYTSYNYYKITNDSDIIVIYHYLVQKLKPIYNESIGINKLSFKIDIPKIIGKEYKVLESNFVAS